MHHHRPGSTLLSTLSTLSILSTLSTPGHCRPTTDRRYAGCEYFHPIVIYQPAISNTLMGYLMLHDINSSDAYANPNTRLSNPLDIFIENACHNGFWRSGFVLKSLVVPAAVIGMAEPYAPALKISATMAALLAFKRASKL